MFRPKTLKKFHVSTQRVYLVGRKNLLQRMLIFFRPYTRRAVYRSTAGALFAL